MDWIKIFKRLEKKNLLFNQINKIKTKIDSSLSNIIRCYLFKLWIPIMHRKFFGIMSQDPDDRNPSFHFATHRGVLLSLNQTQKLYVIETVNIVLNFNIIL